MTMVVLDAAASDENSARRGVVEVPLEVGGLRGAHGGSVLAAVGGAVERGVFCFGGGDGGKEVLEEVEKKKIGSLSSRRPGNAIERSTNML